MPAALAVLLIAQGTVVAALVPLALAGLLATYGVLALLTRWIGFGELVIVIITMLGLGWGIDYAMCVVRRFRTIAASGAVVVVHQMRNSGATVRQLRTVRLTPVQQIGFALAVAIALDATLSAWSSCPTGWLRESETFVAPASANTVAKLVLGITASRRCCP